MAGAFISATTISCNTGEGSVPTLKLSCTTPWVSTVLPSSTRSCPMSPTSVTSCPRWIPSNTVSHHVPVGSCPTHHVPVGSCPTPMDESCWWLSLSRPVPLLVFHLPPYCGINFPDNLYSKFRLDPGLLLTKLRLGSGHSLIQCPNVPQLRQGLVYFSGQTLPQCLDFQQTLHRPGWWGFDSAIDDPKVESTFWFPWFWYGAVSCSRGAWDSS